MYAPQFDYAARALRLSEISTINANGRLFQKLDLITALTMNGSYTVNVYRRYNSDFNIVIEDCYGNLSFHQDEPMYVTLKRRFALSDAEIATMYVSYFYSFKHGTILNYIPCSIFTMKWADIQESYSAIDLALYYQPASPVQDSVDDSSTEEDSVDEDAVKEEEEEKEEAVKEEKPYNSVVYYASSTPFATATSFASAVPLAPTPFATIFVNVHPIPLSDEEEEDNGCCSRICKKRSFCNMRDESEDESDSDSQQEEVEEQEADSDDESHYTVLRNGTKFRKKD